MISSRPEPEQSLFTKRDLERFINLLYAAEILLQTPKTSYVTASQQEYIDALTEELDDFALVGANIADEPVGTLASIYASALNRP